MSPISITLFICICLNWAVCGEENSIKPIDESESLEQTSRVQRQVSFGGYGTGIGGIVPIVHTVSVAVPFPEQHIHHHHINHVVVHKGNAALARAGTPIGETEIRFPNGTKRIIKYSHILHTDITETFPPYLSGFRPPLSPYHPYVVRPGYGVPYPYSNGYGYGHGLNPAGNHHHQLYPGYAPHPYL